ncbi:hypothetical protein ASPVEDRAFT_133883 [Aspergillus versicolor CBS 583.65]|uniref:Peptidase M20 dimerisation domain-containing protein n=1 Tax=Aspergillus versicolor CBS 583.65 TaxID=1036611 RepID=A0A1L9PPF3_ASPVE|nr:uncharacterized protein ASPVEDRAFT_133883 [Aspergillus versicolor CBS 583.65]OJJ03409.1 hypothetical protein ASPVEDRAFT_133883 [Aspergillus versicolor CBS 583.65]
MPPLPAKYASLKVNGNRAIATLEAACTWGSTPDGGMNRLSCNDDDKKARDWFIETTKACGCVHKVDTMGNIFAIRAGVNNNIPPIGLGSHLDTQPTGGKYDGILGVISAIEVLQVIHAAKIRTYAPLAVVNWTNEEGARFSPAMLGAGVWGGRFSNDFAHTCADSDGRTIKAELERIGYLGSTPASYDANPLLAHFEVHIEQGPVLDTREEPVAVGKGVQSIRWYSVDIRGRESHTGTTPMPGRSDALLGAAKFAVEVNNVVTQDYFAQHGARATVSVINSLPQSINTIPGHVRLNVDTRASTDELIQEIEEAIRNRLEVVSKNDGLTSSFEMIWSSPALTFDSTMLQCIRESARSIGCEQEIASGAGHDSVYTSRKVPTAMVFVRCRDGVSHNPAEYSRPEDCIVGAQVLLESYLRYDEITRQSNEGKL